MSEHQEQEKQISVQYVPISDLRAAEYNPRRHTDKQMRDLKESVRRYGMVDPIVANRAENRKNVVVGGHFRLAAAKELGLTEVPVAYVDLPDVEKEKELNLRLNQNGGEWDPELLRGFDPSALLAAGFGNAELGAMWDAALAVDDGAWEGRTPAAAEPAPEPKSLPGQVWRLGDHALMCGDSTDAAQVAALVSAARLGASAISMLYFDPPYNIGLDYRKGMGGGRDYGARKSDDAKGPAEYRAFLAAALGNGLAHAAADAHAFLWCDPNLIGLCQGLMAERGLVTRRVCMWVKNNMNVTPKVAFYRGYEPCVYATRGKPYLADGARGIHEILDREVGAGNRAIDDVADLFDLWLERRLPVADYEHPTAKPPSLHEKPLKRCTAPGDGVLDLFGGSGSTLLACEQLGRRAILMEKEPAFVDVTIARWEEFSGKKAELVAGPGSEPAVETSK